MDVPPSLIFLAKCVGEYNSGQEHQGKTAKKHENLIVRHDATAERG